LAVTARNRVAATTADRAITSPASASAPSATRASDARACAPKGTVAAGRVTVRWHRRYGHACAAECACPPSAQCDPLTGQCHCAAGSEGTTCDSGCVQVGDATFKRATLCGARAGNVRRQLHGVVRVRQRRQVRPGERPVPMHGRLRRHAVSFCFSRGFHFPEWPSQYYPLWAAVIDANAGTLH